MNLFSLKAILDLDASKYEQGLSKAKNMASSVGSAIGTALKVGAAAIRATSAAVGVLGKKAVDAYASYEQLSGGVDKLYGTAADKLRQYAQDAYKTSGMSANQYMETATSFSAALVSSLKGDVAKAADMTDVAMKAISDNVNVFGSDFQSVQNAFQGFAKQNYTMLDNLKLGYGGTKTEMQRLIKDANTYRKSIGQTANLSINSFADVVQAIQSVQEAQNISGTTGKEAMTTIEGSARATKAAWENVITAIGRGEGLGDAMDALFGSFFGRKAGEGMLEQITPRVQTVMKGIGQFIEKAGPILAEKVPALVDAIVPPLLSGGATLAQALFKGIVDNAPVLLSSVGNAVTQLLSTVISVISKSSGGIINALIKLVKDIVAWIKDNATMVLEAIFDIITSIASAIAESLPDLIPAIIEVILEVADYIVSNMDILIDAIVQVMEGLAEGIVRAIPIIIEKLPTIIVKLVEGLLKGIPKLFSAGVDLIKALLEGIFSLFASVGKAGAELISKLWESIKEGVSSAFSWGKDLISNFIKGIFSGVGKLWDGIKSIAGGIKDFLGFSEPEKGPLSDFHTYAPDMMKLFAQGIRDNEHIITDQIAKSFDFENMIGTDIGVSANSNNTVNHTGTIRIEGVNNQGEFVAASEYAIEEIITNIMKREARLA